MHASATVARWCRPRHARGAAPGAIVFLAVIAAVPSAAAAKDPIRVETRVETTRDGPQRVYVARVDLRDPRVDVRVTAPIEPAEGDPTGVEARLETVPAWAEREVAVLALNANFFARLGATTGPWTFGLAVDLIGPSVSEGRVVSKAKCCGLGHPALLLTRARAARISCALEADLEGMDDVVAGLSDPESGGCLLVEDGVNRGEQAPERLRARHPRTAAGLARGGRELLLVVVDGRQPGWSIGMTLAELGALMLRLGARDAINLDGGGSSSFVYRPARGRALANRPSDGNWRPVANHLGIVVRARR